MIVHYIDRPGNSSSEAKVLPKIIRPACLVIWKISLLITLGSSESDILHSSGSETNQKALNTKLYQQIPSLF